MPSKPIHPHLEEIYSSRYYPDRLGNKWRNLLWRWAGSNRRPNKRLISIKQLSLILKNFFINRYELPTRGFANIAPNIYQQKYISLSFVFQSAAEGQHRKALPLVVMPTIRHPPVCQVCFLGNQQNHATNQPTLNQRYILGQHIQ